MKHWRNRAAALGLSLCLVGALCPVARAAGPEVSAQSAVVLTADTGTVLFEKDGHTPRPVASTTKIMTALLALEAAQERGDPLVDITQEMVAVEGSSMGLQAGDSISLTGLAAGMLLASGNDAANAAALYLDASLESFAARMNQRAAVLGMEDTHFVTPSGLDGEDAQGLGHLSTAYDMALLARAALEDQAFRQLCSSPSLAVEFAEPVKRVTYTNHNKLLTQYQGCVGVKTGFTKEAGRCLVSAAERDGALLIAVTLNAPNDWQDHTALLDYGFSQVEPYQLAGGDVRLTVPVVGSPVEVVSLRGSNGGEVTLPLGQGAQVERVVHAPKFLYAPVEAGEQVGKICWYLEGQLLGSAPLTAAGAAPLQEKAPSFWERLFG
ncbi:MAG TPA: D-alanyl-D-alanine carboxypeptidase [Candidatus Acutalibacter ornithocaccae]|uniref:serine-type D-Ala-D-Ala carboxypeptidase n=1 Tax=Candidatus Acutalibacter ornithocaccae TaxID=2838416 RepID=A0A9D2RYQ5_9FIRM|nr:D-alanyl-D-alanine carboxypeptidase [Candidatus Acutalibacter ornithocaccae]